MFLLNKPSAGQIHSFLDAQKTRKLSYSKASPGYTVDHNRIQLGHGCAVFSRAMDAIRQWKMFEMDWLSLCFPETPIEVGATVAVLISHFGFWSLNACRIVYLIEEPNKYGFAYGTLPDHGEIGEERFSVEFNDEDQTVWYDIYAFSRPHVLARLAYPVARALQKRFSRDSMRAMQKAVSLD
jgi:uncharacterized protein (UPF0548 family)